jgi:hypothetical protein
MNSSVVVMIVNSKKLQNTVKNEYTNTKLLQKKIGWKLDVIFFVLFHTNMHTVIIFVLNLHSKV